MFNPQGLLELFGVSKQLDRSTCGTTPVIGSRVTTFESGQSR